MEKVFKEIALLKIQKPRSDAAESSSPWLLRLWNENLWISSLAFYRRFGHRDKPDRKM
jgi:hypothetical protein